MVALPSSPTASAQESELDKNTRLALASFVAEMIECSVYYATNGQLQDNSGTQWKMGKFYQELSENIGLTAFALAETIKMKKETLNAMAESNARKMGQSIDQDAINIRILSNKYGLPCKNLVENPEERIRYWLEKETMKMLQKGILFQYSAISHRILKKTDVNFQYLYSHLLGASAEGET